MMLLAPRDRRPLQPASRCLPVWQHMSDSLRFPNFINVCCLYISRLYASCTNTLIMSFGEFMLMAFLPTFWSGPRTERPLVIDHLCIASRSSSTLDSSSLRSSEMRLQVILLALIPLLAVAQDDDNNAQVTTITSAIESNGQTSTQVITSTITSAASQSSGSNDDNNSSGSGSGSASGSGSGSQSGSASGSGGGHSSSRQSTSTAKNLPTADASNVNGGGSDSAPAPTSGGLSPDDSYHTDAAAVLRVHGAAVAGGAAALGLALLVM